MRIALTHPWAWPEVERGGERLFADLARWLHEAGHDVLAVTAARGGRGRSWGAAEAVPTVRHRVPDASFLARRGLDRPVAYLPQAAWSLARWRPELVHCLFHTDGVAARLARRPYVLHAQGMASRAQLDGRRFQRRLFGPSVRGAAAFVAVSEAVARSVCDEFGLRPRVLHNGVFTADFAVAAAAARTPDPSILFPGDPADPRKRLGLLLDAAAALAPRWPGLSVAVAARVPAGDARRLGERSAVPLAFLDVARPAAMPAAYGRSWVTCLPAVREAFGLVIVESLAAGRPCVAVDDAGAPEVLAEPAWLAPADDLDALVGALDAALRAAQDPATVSRCQSLAAPFDWAERGPPFVALYREIVPG